MTTYLAHHGRPVELVADYVTGKHAPGYAAIVERSPIDRPGIQAGRIRRDRLTVETLTWAPYYSLGKPSAHYFHAELAGMTLELFERLDKGWEWSFYDPTSDDPDLAVARDSAPTREEAEFDLLDYAIGHYVSRA